jgi:hypothetical protein
VGSSVLDVSVIDSGFKPPAGQAKDYRLVFISSPLRRQHIGERANTGWFGISIMFPGGMTFLPAYYCFSE